MVSIVKFLRILIVVTFFCGSCGLVAGQKQDIEYFYVLTIPKSGTHLVKKMLMMLTKRECYHSNWRPYIGSNFVGDYEQDYVSPESVTKRLLKLNKKGTFTISHFHISDLYEEFSRQHPEFVRIIQIRDLRDVLISYINHQGHLIEQEIGPSSFDQKLSFMLSLNGDSRPKTRNLFNIYRFAEKALQWKQKPGVVTCRFENLVGSQGKGSLYTQQKQIKKIAKAIRAPLTPQLLNEITANLFGTQSGPSFPTTFHKGKIGAWKKHFKPHHLAQFNENWAHLQTGLGYTSD
jgi:hypothetical protein